jgi:hypothetical protein
VRAGQLDICGEEGGREGGREGGNGGKVGAVARHYGADRGSSAVSMPRELKRRA